MNKSPQAYVNGRFVPLAEAQISILDRGFLFADGVYEVTAVLDGRLVDFEAHMARLERSTREIELAMPLPPENLLEVHYKLIERAELTEGLVYLQVTRGAASNRDFFWPDSPSPTLVMFTQGKALIDSKAARSGITVRTVPDIRWGRRDIKSVMLLTQVLAKHEAAKAGAQDAWLVEPDGTITEGASTTAFIVRGNALITRPNSQAILPGCTAKAVLRLATETGVVTENRTFTVAEALAADEAFSTSATTFVLPVVEIDGQKIGDGVPGPVTMRLRQIYIDVARGL